MKKKRNRPPFPIEAWSQYQSILDDSPSTNNSIESFNKTWNSVTGPNSSLWKVINQFNKEDADALRALAANTIGQDIHQNSGRKDHYRSGRENIKKIVLQWHKVPEDQFINMIGKELARIWAN